MKTVTEVWEIETYICKCLICGELTNIECYKNYHEQCNHCGTRFFTSEYLHNIPLMCFIRIDKEDICTFVNKVCYCPHCKNLTQLDYNDDKQETCDSCKKSFKTKKTWREK